MATRRELLAAVWAWACGNATSARAGAAGADGRAQPHAREAEALQPAQSVTRAAEGREPTRSVAREAHATERPPPVDGAAAELAAAWDEPAGHRVGVLAAARDGTLRVASALAVPTRAHGLLAEPAGHLLAVARRPGDWLMRWSRDGRRLQEHWIEPDRAFNGHLLASADGRLLYSSETDLESGAGLVGVRDARTLERLATWPTHGLDPHELLWDADGSLLVANGGIPTRPETGRAKRGLERMDPSLVRLDPSSGRLLGQWRLDDARLSVRHLARQGARTAIALQAEHDDPARRAAAPVLALFDGAQLRLAETPLLPLAGYGGSVAGAAGRFFVGCPRAGGTGCWNADGHWLGFVPLAEACPLAAHGGGVWSGGRDSGRWTPAVDAAGSSSAAGAAGPVGPDAGVPDPAVRGDPRGGVAAFAPPLAGLRLDNHWIALG